MKKPATSVQAERTSRAPRQRRSEETREKLLAAGRTLFSTEGFHATNSKKIAALAGVSTGTFYNYFEDKRALLMEIHRLHARKIHEMITESLSREAFERAAPTGDNLGREIVEQSLRLHELSPSLHREITALAYSDLKFAEMSRDEEDRVVALMVGLFERRKAQLRVDDLEAAARVVVHAAEQVVHSIKIFGSPIEEKRLTNALGDMIFRFLYKDS